MEVGSEGLFEATAGFPTRGGFMGGGDKLTISRGRKTKMAYLTPLTLYEGGKGK